MALWVLTKLIHFISNSGNQNQYLQILDLKAFNFDSKIESKWNSILNQA
jgi:hypothetical protein